MKRILLLLAVLAFSAVTLAQDKPAYQPVVPSPTVVAGGYGGWSGYTGASTAAGSAMNGMSNVISAQGQRNLSNSAAAVNWTQAQKNEMENYSQWTDTYFQARAANKAFRAAEAGPKVSQDAIIRFDQAGRPKPLTSRQLNPDGRIAWPSLLRSETFADNRQQVDQVYLKRAEQGGIGIDDLEVVDSATKAMINQLKQMVAQVPASVYTSSKSFLQSLAYTAKVSTN